MWSRAIPLEGILWWGWETKTEEATRCAGIEGMGICWPPHCLWYLKLSLMVSRNRLREVTDCGVLWGTTVFTCHAILLVSLGPYSETSFLATLERLPRREYIPSAKGICFQLDSLGTFFLGLVPGRIAISYWTGGRQSSQGTPEHHS